MAEQSFMQRGLQGFRDTMRDLRTGEGKGGAAAIGRGAKKAAKNVKGGLGRLKKAFGFSYVDAFNEDIEEQRRRKRARQFMGDDEPEYVGVRTQDPKRDLATVAPEYRAQVSSGLAAANSMTTGSTLVDGGKGGGGGDDDGRW
jgi:hypothetical protein